MGFRVLPYSKTESDRVAERRKRGTGSLGGIAGPMRRSRLLIPEPLPLNDKRWLNENTKNLCKALLTINTEDEMQNFLRDLMTKKELIEFGNRWRAVRMLASGESYTKIGFETYLSSRTIARIKRWLTEGTGGYELVLRRIKK